GVLLSAAGPPSHGGRPSGRAGRPAGAHGRGSDCCRRAARGATDSNGNAGTPTLASLARGGARERGNAKRTEGRDASTKVVARRRGGVGESVRRVDGAPKVKGQFLYSSDLWAEDMLWGYTLRSPHPHARIASIDLSLALRATGVHAVLVAADVPGRKTYGLEIADQPVLAIDGVRYQGEPVAVLAANDLEL